MDKKIYLTVSGFNIEIYLTKASNNVFQDKIKKEIYYSCKEFINVHKPEKIDYVIKFLETPQIPSFTKKRIFYISLYAEKTKTIETYYQINSTLFLVILKYILVKLLGNKGFFLHGSASLINNKANLFLGKPGSGKSTIISLINKKYQSLADDILILRKEHGQYLVYQSPFLEKIFLTKKSTPYYLGKIFFLKKRKFVKIIKNLIKT
jgi:serine kinase of HPr protein (carbohydrate metabolism regulator)